MGKLNTSSNWTLAAVYGGFVVAAVNPIAGVIVAAACYKVKTKLAEQEKIERAMQSKAERDDFRGKFYSRQCFSSYEEYLASETWNCKRDAVLKRADGVCEKATCNQPLAEVHHAWYPRVWGEEPLTALVGLCRAHHEAEHKPRF